MADATFKQDMPPEGGYKTIPFKRVPCKSLFSGRTLLVGYLGMTAAASYVYYLTDLSIHKEELELRSGRLAIHPLLMAERDRAYLKQLRRNRDDEAELMKNVECWKVGTWFGEPIYETEPDKFVQPSFHEYYAHTDSWSRKLRSHFVWWS